MFPKYKGFCSAWTSEMILGNVSNVATFFCDAPHTTGEEVTRALNVLEDQWKDEAGGAGNVF